MMRGRRRQGRYGRKPNPVYINHTTTTKAFNPEPKPHGEPVQIEPAELEAIRLTDLENLNQEEAGEKMGVSRGTIWRLLQSGREKIALAIVEGRKIELREIE
jgi:predicted DNA-binding protein (UPF0251 family)